MTLVAARGRADGVVAGCSLGTGRLTLSSQSHFLRDRRHLLLAGRLPYVPAWLLAVCYAWLGTAPLASRAGTRRRSPLREGHMVRSWTARGRGRATVIGIVWGLCAAALLAGRSLAQTASPRSLKPQNVFLIVSG